MKSLIICLLLITSFKAFSAVQVYQITQAMCLEVHPFVLGDVCVLELANQKEQIVIVTDFELPDMHDISESELVKMDVGLSKKELRKLKREEAEEVRSLVKKGLPMYKIDAALINLL